MLHNLKIICTLNFIVKYFALGKPEKARFPRKNIEKGSEIYRSLIHYSYRFYSVVKQ